MYAFMTRKVRFAFTLIVVALLLHCGTPFAQELTVIGWNVESGDAFLSTLANTIADTQGTDIWGLSEVEDGSWAARFEVAAEDGENADFQHILGSTGASDRLVIIYDGDKLEEIRHFELENINIGGNVRAPLVAHFKVKANGPEFFFMVNHLYRSNNTARHNQARMLNEWAKAQTLPVIAVGDYNFDWDVPGGDERHDRGYDNIIKDGVFTWVRPETLMPTQCHATFKSVLDFVFVTGVAQSWTGASQILFPETSYCPDNASKSDHRPVLAKFELQPGGGGGGGESVKAALLMQIQKIEDELKALKIQVEGMGR